MLSINPFWVYNLNYIMSINSNQEFSNVGYAFLMFLTDYYKRVGKLKLTFDEMMVLNTVAAQLGLSLIHI